MLLVSGYRNVEWVSVQSDPLTGMGHKSYNTCRKDQKMCVCGLTHFADSGASVGEVSLMDKSPGERKGGVLSEDSIRSIFTFCLGSDATTIILVYIDLDLYLCIDKT